MNKTKNNKGIIGNSGNINKVGSNKINFLIIVLFIFFLLILFLSSCKLFPAGEEKTIPKGIEVEVEIKEGMTLKEVSKLLEGVGVIDNSFLFRLYVQQKGKETSLIPGVYTLKTGSDYETVLEEITTGPPVIYYKLVIPEGYTVDQVADKIISDVPFIEYSDLKQALDVNSYNYDFLKNANSLEGFLFPKTYDITIDYNAKNIIEMMLAQYQLETSNLDYSFAEENNLSHYDILIIASMVEREAYIPEERGLISAVIHNRLEMDMPLGIDATIRYALNKWDEDLTVSDLNVDSEYNTRIYKGLPPTPICNPGLASIKAALAPADVDYLYFVVTDPQTHAHSFSTNYEEHRALQNGSK